ncbi:hypothetical protein PM082_018584 [Marasmius tenuissimus]|nr:hypothetical protein PM082_018584 [Marasmius tenuissimus]
MRQSPLVESPLEIKSRGISSSPDGRSQIPRQLPLRSKEGLIFHLNPASASQQLKTPTVLVLVSPYGSPSSTFPSGNATWVVPRANLNGVLGTYGETKCLDLRNGDSRNGNALQIWSCDAANPNQIWRVDALIPRGQAKVTRDGATKCLDIKNGNFAPGADIQIWDCDPSGNNLNQQWSARQQ